MEFDEKAKKQRANVGKDGYLSFFQNTDAINCPITSCSLMKRGCTDPYAGNLNMETSTPWQVSMPVDDAEGWKEEVCYMCTNGKQTIQRDGFIIEQRGRCHNALTTSSTKASVSKFDYKNTTELKDIGSAFNNFFRNRYPT